MLRGGSLWAALIWIVCGRREVINLLERGCRTPLAGGHLPVWVLAPQAGAHGERGSAGRGSARCGWRQTGHLTGAPLQAPSFRRATRARARASWGITRSIWTTSFPLRMVGVAVAIARDAVPGPEAPVRAEPDRERCRFHAGLSTGPKKIKHDGFRLMAGRDPVGIRLITRRGHDWAGRYPLVVEAVNHLKVSSCLIDGEVVCCDPRGVADFRLLRHRQNEPKAFLYATSWS